MKNWDRIRELLGRYYEGDTTVAEERELKDALQTSILPEDLRLEARLLGWALPEQRLESSLTEEQLFNQLPQTEDTPPSAEKSSGSIWPMFMQIAAAVALLVVGFALGSYRNEPAAALPAEATTELTAMRQELESLKEMLQQGATTGQRLQAVNVASTSSNADAELLMALTQTMHFDDNVNVRLAAVEALMNYRQHPLVRQALIHSLSIQSDPNVQLMLIQGLTQMQEKDALPQLQELLKQPKLQQVVRQKVEESIAILI